MRVAAARSLPVIKSGKWSQRQPPSRHRRAEGPPRRLAGTLAGLGEMALLAALCVISLLCLHSTYGGTTYLVAGCIGVALGLVVGYGSAAARLPALVAATLAVVAYFAGGLLVPGPRSLDGLVQLAGNGWKQLLTTLPPIGNSGPLVALPFLMGLAAAALGSSLALRMRASFLPLLAPVALLAGAILLGMPTAPTVLLAAASTAAALGWAAIRHQRSRPTVQHGARQTTRAALGIAMLAAAAVGASAIGPAMPLAEANRRLVLRNYVEPPFDLQQYPSPLAGFRKYTRNGALYDTTLFTVRGLPQGAPVRIATMTTYDGLVWATGDPTLTTASTATFQRVGTSITTKGSGTSTRVTVQVSGYDDVWVPTAGPLSRIGFAGSRRKQDAGAFRYNLDTATGVLPPRLQSGESYSMRALVPPAPLDLSRFSPYGSPEISADYTAFVGSAIGQWTNGVNGVWPQVMAIARHLREVGKYSDGTGDEAQYLPGHSIGRLTAFLNGRQLVGDDEQYAATFALMADYLGVPARVVLGAQPESGGVVKGKDVHAWVEVHVADGSWQQIPTEQFMPDTSKRPDNIPPQQQQNSAAAVVPPPNAVRPPSNIENPDQQQSRVDRRKNDKTQQRHEGFQIPRGLLVAGTYGGPPLLFVVIAALSIMGLKAWRRRRRRLRGAPASRVAAGWRELVDHARDLGRHVPGGQTRREDALALGPLGLEPLAASADAVVFGPGHPPPESAVWYWTEVARMRKQMTHGLGPWRRLRVAVSLRSLRTPRPPIRVPN